MQNFWKITIFLHSQVTCDNKPKRPRGGYMSPKVHVLIVFSFEKSIGSDLLHELKLVCSSSSMFSCVFSTSMSQYQDASKLGKAHESS